MTSDKKLYYVSTTCGCAIRRGTSTASIVRQMASEVGTDNVREIRPATDEDIAWVRGMGGRVPEAT